MRIKQYIPVKIKRKARKLLSISHTLGNNRYCPICENSSRKFAKYRGRIEAKCLNCGSLERHRLVWCFLKKRTSLFDGLPKKFLHVAPEPKLGELFKEILKEGYLSGDLENPDAMVKMDITNIQYAKNSFDIIYCSHVLEHVPEDKQAMQEFYRVLKPNGWAIILVPITANKTLENSSITSPEERLKIFGQVDHVRRYGHDFVQRLISVGFKVSEIKPSDFLTDEEKNKMRIIEDSIFFCEK